MRDLNDLYYFAQVVEHQGFAPASRALHVPKSKLSRRVALLEEELGVRLIQRSSRHFSVTDIGQEFYRHCQAMLVEANAADEAIALRRAEPQGVVRVSCPIALLQARVDAILADFMLECPKVTVMLESTNRRVDVIAEGFDIAIRARPPPLEDSDLALRVFAERSWRLVASPSLVTRLGRPLVPADLSSFPTVDMVPPVGPHIWELDGPGAAHASLYHTPRMVTDDMIALRTAAMHGVGVTQLPDMIVTDQLKSGDLIALLPDWSPKLGIVHAVFPSRRGLLPSVRALIDFLASRLGDAD
ncbi:MAG TPA: LysR family transcriptional regulator [Dyella sp.]|uniref:LysR family transcriptional regulator n=1 Tax=Dyella sp. TaxID=1869338 RepID=UPI002D790513|nr:LysR family transcriptional regulator [Dyella sp.]HET6553515.1 LysR family transcriptional regulator [Dyella sp.]